MSKIELHIGELVLEGWPSVDRARLQKDFERELARILAERGTPAGLERSGTSPVIEARMEPGVKTDDLGARIGRAVAGGLKRL